MRKKKAFFMHTPHNSQSIIYEWPMSKFLKKHIPK